MQHNKGKRRRRPPRLNGIDRAYRGGLGKGKEKEEEGENDD